MQAIQILMPSEMRSRDHACADEDEVIRVLKSFSAQMKAWKNFEAWLLVMEDGVEMSREHIKQ